MVHPFHPLYGQRLAVIAIRRRADPDLVVRLPDGSAAAIAQSLTSVAPPHLAPATASMPPLLSPPGLRQLAVLVAALGRSRRELAADPPEAPACAPAGLPLR